MRHRELLLCCLALAAWSARAQDVRPTDPGQAAIDGDIKKKDAPKAAKPKAAPLPLDLQAAQSLVGALKTAISAVSADNSGFKLLSEQQADLQNQLSHGANAAEISRQALGLFATLYKPAQLNPEPAPPAEPKADWKLPAPWLPWGLAILVALLSPLICVAGFLIGARTAENSVRNTLREAGLL